MHGNMVLQIVLLLVEFYNKVVFLWGKKVFSCYENFADRKLHDQLLVNPPKIPPPKQVKETR